MERIGKRRGEPGLRPGIFKRQRFDFGSAPPLVVFLQMSAGEELRGKIFFRWSDTRVVSSASWGSRSISSKGNFATGSAARAFLVPFSTRCSQAWHGCPTVQGIRMADKPPSAPPVNRPPRPASPDERRTDDKGRPRPSRLAAMSGKPNDPKPLPLPRPPVAPNPDERRKDYPLPKPKKS